MTKEEVEQLFYNHPIIKRNQELLDKYGTPMFKNKKEKEKSIAQFAVDNKFITRREWYKLYGSFHDYKPVWETYE